MVRFIFNVLALVCCGCLPAAAGNAEAPHLGLGHELVAPQSGDGRIGDLYGTAYDIDGNTLAVGAWRDGVADINDVGSVYLYTRVSGQWQLQQKLTHPVPEEGRRFGYSVAVSGDSLIVGSPGNGGSNSSGAYIYTRAGSGWSLALPMVGYGTAFGTTVDIAGSFAYATNGFSNCVNICLSTVVSQRVSGAWLPGQPIPAPEVAVPYLSASAAISADGTLVIGADANAQNGDRIIAQVLRVQSGATVPVQRLTVPSSFAHEFGTLLSVALAADGGTLAIGAPNTSYVDRPSTGAVFLWRRVGDVWTAMNAAVDSLPAGRTSHGFGRYIAMDGDRLAATFFEGDVGEPPSVDLAAGVRAFSRSNNVWLATDRTVRDDALSNPYGPLVLSGQHLFTVGNERSAVDLERAYAVIREHSSSHAGAAVVASAFNPPGMRGFRYGDGLASSGPLLLVGSPGPTSGFDTGRGAVYVFRRGTGAPVQIARLVATGGHPGDAFGAAIAADEEVVMIGAPSQVVGVAPGRGAVHVYARQGETLTYRGMLSNPQTIATAGFGNRIAMQSGRALVASNGPPAVGTGRVDYFMRDGAGVFQPITFLVNPSPSESGSFGASLAIDGSRVAIGHTRLDHPAATPPRVSIFTATPTALQPETILTSTNAGFGSSIALAGDRLLVGASGIPSTTGRIVPYNRTSGVWIAQPEIANPDGGSVLTLFGATLARSGEFVYVGAPALGFSPGFVYRYHDPVSAAPMTFLQRLNGLRPHNSDRFGSTIAAMADGSVFVSSLYAGGLGDFDNPDDGAVYEFGDYLLIDGFE